MKQSSVNEISASDLTENYAKGICSYLSRIEEKEIKNELRNLNRKHLSILFQTAITSGKYRLCLLLQQVSLSAPESEKENRQIKK